MQMFLVSSWRGFPLWQLLAFTTRECVSLTKRMQNCSSHFYKIYLLFHILQRNTTRIPPRLLEGRQEVRDTEVPVALGGGGQATAGGACSTNPQRKRRSGQFSSKHNAFLRLEHQKWLLSIVNTGRWHKAYKPSLELGAERWLGPGAERLRGTKLSRGCGTELRSSDILRTMDSELGQSWNSLGVLLLRLYNGGDHGTSFPARFWGVSAQ